MGELSGGTWHRGGVERVMANGELRRPPSVFRDWITANGGGPCQAEAGRYHFYALPVGPIRDFAAPSAREGL